MTSSSRTQIATTVLSKCDRYYKLGVVSNCNSTKFISAVSRSLASIEYIFYSSGAAERSKKCVCGGGGVGGWG